MVLNIVTFVVNLISKLKEFVFGFALFKAGETNQKRKEAQSSILKIKKELGVEREIDKLSASDVFARLRDKYSRENSKD